MLKRLSIKAAAASKEARRYVPHFVGPFAPRMDVGERINPSGVSDFRKTLIEPLSDASTLLADFFSILLVNDFRRWSGDLVTVVPAEETGKIEECPAYRNGFARFCIGHRRKHVLKPRLTLGFLRDRGSHARRKFARMRRTNGRAPC
jgi:hypothetical protein